MALRTKDVAEKYKGLLEDYLELPPGAVGIRLAHTLRLKEVRGLLIKSLAPVQRRVLSELRRRKVTTSREIADLLNIKISYASNILGDLADYGLAERFSLYRDPELMERRPDLLGYPGRTYRYSDPHAGSPDEP